MANNDRIYIGILEELRKDAFCIA